MFCSCNYTLLQLYNLNSEPNPSNQYGLGRMWDLCVSVLVNVCLEAWTVFTLHPLTVDPQKYGLLTNESAIYEVLSFFFVGALFLCLTTQQARRKKTKRGKKKTNSHQGAMVKY